MFNRMHRHTNDPETQKRRLEERGKNAQYRFQGGTSKFYIIITVVTLIVIAGIVLFAIFS